MSTLGQKSCFCGRVKFRKETAILLPLPPESSSDAIALLEPLALGEGFGGLGGGHVGLDAMGDEGFDGSGEAVAGGDVLG